MTEIELKFDIHVRPDQNVGRTDVENVLYQTHSSPEGREQLQNSLRNEMDEDENPLTIEKVSLGSLELILKVNSITLEKLEFLDKSDILSNIMTSHLVTKEVLRRLNEVHSVEVTLTATLKVHVTGMSCNKMSQ